MRRRTAGSSAPWASRRVMSADETIVKVRGKAKLVGFVADAASRRLLGTDILVKRGSGGFTNWLK